MPIRSQVALALLSALLFVAGHVIRTESLWSQISGFTVPWFCSAIALALLLILVVCLLRDQAPSALPLKVVIGTVIAVAVVLFAGIQVDYDAYQELEGLAGTRWEIGGFVGVLLATFLVARRKPGA